MTNKTLFDRIKFGDEAFVSLLSPRAAMLLVMVYTCLGIACNYCSAATILGE